MSKIHLELMDRERLDVFKKLSAFKYTGYLAGGTALALQINHRISEDFDVFVSQRIDNSLRLKAGKIFGDISFYVNTTDQISFTTENGVRITFLWYYFKPIKSQIYNEILPLASLEDIAADKAHAIGRRAVWRDYVDIFYIMKNNYLDLGKIISLAEEKFRGEFVSIQFLEQLRYFDDLKTVPVEFVNKKYSYEEIKSYLNDTVKNYFRYLPDDPKKLN